jgi:hypothetical protein
MVYVASSAISRVEYDPSSRVMQIWFTSSRRAYSFCGVPENIYSGLLNAASKGTYYDQHIRDRYQC